MGADAHGYLFSVGADAHGYLFSISSLDMSFNNACSFQSPSCANPLHLKNNEYHVTLLTEGSLN